DRQLISAPSQSPKRARIRSPAPVRPIGGDEERERPSLSTTDDRRRWGTRRRSRPGSRASHAAFLEVMSSELPDGYATQEVNHLTLAYFSVAGLSLLRELDRVS
uniref:Uncharacterized protein n=1 Tax=Triticum urartu TaxID=4572 RepID=A0A8R7TRW8_TRIUA